MRYSIGSSGLSRLSAARPSSKMGTTVWSKYCLVGKLRMSARFLFASGRSGWSAGRFSPAESAGLVMDGVLK
jgi:hypothetical protein